MGNCILVGCDLHDANMLLKVAVGAGAVEQRLWRNTSGGRRVMIRDLQRRAQRAGAERVVLAYEASSLGFGLHDELTASGIECHVLAPTKIARSVQDRREKTDERDAQRLLDLVRAHVLAGNRLPSVWIPDQQTRDDRELVRARLDVSHKLTGVKTQVRTLLKRNGVSAPESAGKSWTVGYRAWVARLAGGAGALAWGARLALGSLLRQLDFLEKEGEGLNAHIGELAGNARYAEPAQALQAMPGVGLLTAMVFLTEMGDLGRFANRRQVGAYLGLVPSSHESGASNDRKGHITHQGPSRVRKVLCQAAWARIRWDQAEGTVYERIAEKNPRHRKVAVVALMRRLAVQMWHVGQAAQERSGAVSSKVAV